MERLMTVIKTLMLIAAIGFVFQGCEDYLSTTPSDQYTENNFWTSEEQAQASLTGVYETLRGYHANQIFFNSKITPNAVRFDNPGGGGISQEGWRRQQIRFSRAPGRVIMRESVGQTRCWQMSII